MLRSGFGLGLGKLSLRHVKGVKTALIPRSQWVMVIRQLIKANPHDEILVEY